jgi:hypothetical protein
MYVDYYTHSGRGAKKGNPHASTGILDVLLMPGVNMKMMREIWRRAASPEIFKAATRKVLKTQIGGRGNLHPK